MPRWRQCRETGKFIPIDDAARTQAASANIHGDIEPFRSPVDGSIISDRKQLREHNKRNNVVSTDEFSPEFYAKKAEERERFFKGERSREETLARKQELYEVLTRAERR